MDPGLSIVLLGHTGVGKSASGNTILGRPAFDSRQAFRSVTTQISEATETVFGKQISVIDTPGILGSEREIERWCQELLLSSRPCVFLVVFSVGRFTREQGKVLMAVSRVLGPQMLNKCHLLFTGGDALKGRSLEDFICEDNETKPQVATFSGYHLFNNVNGGPEQVQELLMKAGHLNPEQPPDSPANAFRERRVVLLGLPGGGRSSSGNTILGSEVFKSGCGFDSVSTESVSQSALVEGCKVTVVDTPGFTDEVLTPEQLYQDIMKKIITASPAPHAFVIVVRIRTITNADLQLFELLPKLFTSEALKNSVVLFTHGDALKDQSMEEMIQSNPHVSQLVSLCGGRYCVFDNRANREREQVRSFLTKVDEMVTANGGQHFTSDMLKSTQSGGRAAGRVYRTWGVICRFVKFHKSKIFGFSLILTVIAVRRMNNEIIWNS